MTAAPMPNDTDVQQLTYAHGRYSYYDRVPGPGEKVDAVNIDVYYDKGGTNIFSGKEQGRGVWVTLSPVTREQRGSGIATGFQIGDNRGRRFLARELARKNDRVLLEVVAALSPQLEAIAAAWREEPVKGFDAMADALGIARVKA